MLQDRTRWPIVGETEFCVLEPADRIALIDQLLIYLNSDESLTQNLEPEFVVTLAQDIIEKRFLSVDFISFGLAQICRNRSKLDEDLIRTFAC